jgi:hypothetical protein
MQIVDKTIGLQDLDLMAQKMFGNFVKAVVDVDKGIMAVDAELHADEEAFLIEKGSKQSDLWGINLYPEMEGENFVEYDSMINIKPAQGNRTRTVADPALRAKILSIVTGIVKR